MHCAIGIKSLLQIPNRIRRQGFVALFGQGGLAGLAPVAVAGVATAGVFRNEIAQIIEDIAGKGIFISFKWHVLIVSFNIYFPWLALPFRLLFFKIQRPLQLLQRQQRLVSCIYYTNFKPQIIHVNIITAC